MPNNDRVVRQEKYEMRRNRCCSLSLSRDRISGRILLAFSLDNKGDNRDAISLRTNLRHSCEDTMKACAHRVVSRRCKRRSTREIKYD